MNAKKRVLAGAAGDKPLAWPGDPESLTPEAVDFEAVALVLANTCRRDGRMRRFHSLAAHAVTMSEAIEDLSDAGGEDVRGAALLALLYEASVAWLGPDAAPSRRPTPKLRRLGEKIDRAVREAAGLGTKPTSAHAELVCFVSRMAESAEARDVPGASGNAAPAVVFPPLDRRIRSLDPARAARLWLERLSALRQTPGSGAPETNAPGEDDHSTQQEEPHATQAQTATEETGTPRAGGPHDAA